LQGLPAATPTLAGQVFPWVRLVERQDVPGIGGAADGRAVILFGVFVVVLFVLYAVMVWSARRMPAGAARGVAWACGAVLLASQLVSPVMLSEDAFGYAAGGRM